jgi:drug/metabolite transporter (DMT)-like permease|tara:strand:- start:1741 stop:2166 length:426 start_codon:yes stop_codon:yes gene_type:complete
MDMDMKLTFKEKSLWIQITTLTLVFGSYFLNMNYNITNGLPPNLIFDFIWLLIAFIALNILAHIFAAVFNKPECEDERDKLIELKATRIKAFILATGIIITILASLTLENQLLTINLLLLFLVVSEVIEKVIQLFYYQKGL